MFAKKKKIKKEKSRREKRKNKLNRSLVLVAGWPGERGEGVCGKVLHLHRSVRKQRLSIIIWSSVLKSTLSRWNKHKGSKAPKAKPGARHSPETSQFTHQKHHINFTKEITEINLRAMIERGFSALLARCCSPGTSRCVFFNPFCKHAFCVLFLPISPLSPF